MYVSESPAAAVAAETALDTARSALVTARVLIVVASLPGPGSGVSLLTRTVLVIWPPVPAATSVRMMTVNTPGLATRGATPVPSVQVTVPPAAWQSPLPATADTKVTSEGRRSVTTVFSASEGPRFVMTSV